MSLTAKNSRIKPDNWLNHRVDVTKQSDVNAPTPLMSCSAQLAIETERKLFIHCFLVRG